MCNPHVTLLNKGSDKMLSLTPWCLANAELEKGSCIKRKCRVLKQSGKVEIVKKIHLNPLAVSFCSYNFNATQLFIIRIWIPFKRKPFIIIYVPVDTILGLAYVSQLYWWGKLISHPVWNWKSLKSILLSCCKLKWKTVASEFSVEMVNLDVMGWGGGQHLSNCITGRHLPSEVAWRWGDKRNFVGWIFDYHTHVIA